MASEITRTVTVTVRQYEDGGAEFTCDADGEEWASGTGPNLTSVIDTALHYAGVHLGDRTLPFEGLAREIPGGEA